MQIALKERGILEISGPDAFVFLQRLITQDLKKIRPDKKDFLSSDLLFSDPVSFRVQAVYGALLTPQGRYSFDFLLACVQKKDEEAKDGGARCFWLELARSCIPDLIKMLTLYRLNQNVMFYDRSPEVAVFVDLGSQSRHALKNKIRHGLRAYEKIADQGAIKRNFQGFDTEDKSEISVQMRRREDNPEVIVAFHDPRHPAMGERIWMRREVLKQEEGPSDDFENKIDFYRALRMVCAVPEGEMIAGKSLPLVFGLDALGAISWEKGCYPGQELTARTRYRGGVNKRLRPFLAILASDMMRRPENRHDSVARENSVLHEAVLSYQEIDASWISETRRDHGEKRKPPYGSEPLSGSKNLCGREKVCVGLTLSRVPFQEICAFSHEILGCFQGVYLSNASKKEADGQA